jgi:DNA-binding GntR family transcriptional regulator
LRLVDEGLVVVEAHFGARVRRLGPDEVQHMYDVRAALEGWAAYKAAERPRDIVEPLLKEGLARFKESHELAFPQAVAGDLAFHEAVCRASGNEWLISAWRRLSGPITIALLSAGSELVFVTQSPQHHQRVMRLIVRGDPEGARSLVVDHLAQAARRVVARMRSGPAGSLD